MNCLPRRPSRQRNTLSLTAVNRYRANTFRHTPQRRGFVLVMVLIVVAMLALSTYTFCSLMTTELESVKLGGQQLRAQTAVDSGVAHMMYALEMEPNQLEGLGGLYDNPQLFQAQLVHLHESPQGRVRFGIVSPRQDDLGYWGGYRFGLQDESARLNLNALNLNIEAGADLDEEAEDDEEGEGEEGPGDEDEEEGGLAEIDLSGRAMLMKLPGMTLDIADAILDWIDDDDEPREYGAEFDYYSGEPVPYEPANGPLKSIEELLLVRGVTPELLFGRDINRNGMIEPQEYDIQLYIDADTSNGAMDFGWSAYLTLYSQESNMTRDGEFRVDLNAEDLETLYNELSAVIEPTWATFIILYRQYGPYEGEVEEPDSAAGQELDFERQGGTNIEQVLDLVGVNVRITTDTGAKIIASPFSDDPLSMSAYLATLMDAVTVNPSDTIPGRINVNRAPRLVLEAIPGMTPEIVDQILNQRDMANSEYQDDLSHETWLMSRAIVTLDEMKTIMPYITAGGDVYRAQIIGYFDHGEIASRVEVVVDGTVAFPRILSWKDISHLGRGYAAATLGVDLAPAVLGAGSTSPSSATGSFSTY